MLLSGNKKFRFFIPSFFTLLNLFLGFVSIYLVLSGFTDIAIRLVILGAVADFIDGRISRFLKLDAEIGKEIDTLSDVITFGVAPSFIFLVSFKALFSDLSFLSFPLAFLILLSVVYRLARFSLYGDVLSYIGVSSPTASMACLPLYVYLKDSFLFRFVPFVHLFLAFLMVSRIVYPSLKHTKIYNPFVFPFVLSAVVLSLIFGDWLIFFLVLGWVYIVLGPFLKDRVTPTFLGIDETSG